MSRDIFGEFSEDGKRVFLSEFQRFLVKEQVRSSLKYTLNQGLKMKGDLNRVRIAVAPTPGK